MLLNNSVYIKFIWGFLILAGIFYILPYFFHDYTTPILSNGATLYDVIYYDSEGIFQWALSMTFSTMCLILDSNFKKLSLGIMKYLSYSLSAILFVSTCFHFYYFNKSPDIELYIYGACVLIIATRAWYTIGNLKTILSLWSHRLRYR